MAHLHLPHDHGQQHQDLLVSHFPLTEEAEQTSNLFRQLSDCTRMRIFWILCHCEECVINISAMMDMSSPAVSHHLKLLKNAGLIVSRREGKEVYYKAAETQKAALLHETIEKLLSLTCPTQ